ncbi:unnamed protein product, partial [marine sediment metagenome]
GIQMFCVIYEFTVNPEYEKEFLQLWHDLSMEIKTHSAGLGSRLHKNTSKECVPNRMGKPRSNCV